MSKHKHPQLSAEESPPQVGTKVFVLPALADHPTLIKVEWIGDRELGYTNHKGESDHLLLSGLRYWENVDPEANYYFSVFLELGYTDDKFEGVFFSLEDAYAFIDEQKAQSTEKHYLVHAKRFYECHWTRKWR